MFYSCLDFYILKKLKNLFILFIFTLIYLKCFSIYILLFSSPMLGKLHAWPFSKPLGAFSKAFWLPFPKLFGCLFQSKWMPFPKHLGAFSKAFGCLFQSFWGGGFSLLLLGLFQSLSFGSFSRVGLFQSLPAWLSSPCPPGKLPLLHQSFSKPLMKAVPA